jgi:hypothetical protein
MRSASIGLFLPSFETLLGGVTGAGPSETVGKLLVCDVAVFCLGVLCQLSKPDRTH